MYFLVDWYSLRVFSEESKNQARDPRGFVRQGKTDVTAVTVPSHDGRPDTRGGVDRYVRPTCWVHSAQVTNELQDAGVGHKLSTRHDVMTAHTRWFLVVQASFIAIAH